jgi:hypothetical protein
VIAPKSVRVVTVIGERQKRKVVFYIFPTFSHDVLLNILPYSFLTVEDTAGWLSLKGKMSFSLISTFTKGFIFEPENYSSGSIP